MNHFLKFFGVLLKQIRHDNCHTCLSNKQVGCFILLLKSQLKSQLCYTFSNKCHANTLCIITGYKQRTILSCSSYSTKLSTLRPSCHTFFLQIFDFQMLEDTRKISLQESLQAWLLSLRYMEMKIHGRYHYKKLLHYLELRIYGKFWSLKRSLHNSSGMLTFGT